MDFSNTENTQPIQTFTLTEKDFKEGEALLPVYFVKFQKVKNLTLFVENNLGNTDTSAISHISVFGKSNKTITKVEGVIE